MLNYQSKIGYACMNEDVVPNSYKTCRKENITNEKLFDLIKHNLQVLENTLEYNITHQNHMFRISSSLIPFGSSPLNTLDWQKVFQEDFSRLSQLILNHDIRVSMHPGQYTVLNSPHPHVIESSIRELEYHAILLDLLSGNPNHKMILHIGGVYENKESAMQRFIEVYQTSLSKNIRKYLVIENDDRLYTVQDALYISNQISIPVVFDNLHHEINPSLENISMHDILEKVTQTWTSVDGTPKMHYSQQSPNKRLGAHTQTINLEQFQQDYLNIYSLFPTDIMLEVKDKNRSFIKVNQFMNPSSRVMEKEWAKYKYWTMARSQNAYNQLRLMFKNNQYVDVISFYAIIDGLLETPDIVKSQVNAAQHVWGYFKKESSIEEKNTFMSLIADYQLSKITSKKIYRFLHKMAIKYESTYLLDSYYFY